MQEGCVSQCQTSYAKREEGHLMDARRLVHAVKEPRWLRQ